ncbi:MAG: bifunctional UDP-4-keto-pentose/UDP-xylose synthase [Holosporales bacterium]|jgi:nucleoside-diphosphate-sugar epimerase|nr:bifunctional UDP-4-keto-pentose/UDP-xylose synthase [Holosporales bacterium]
MKVLTLGINGFIGSTLTEKILKDTDWRLFGMDLNSDWIKGHTSHPRLTFQEGDITICKEWIEYHVKKCDVVLPLVAIATPATYVSDPLRVFDLDFAANLEIIKMVVKYKKRIIFPSTSEVYGMCQDSEFKEEGSNLTVGPINKQRWIYSCCKQLLDRVIYAYGIRDGLDYTLFRPFNWIGPRLDSIGKQKEGGSRVLSQFISNILYAGEIKLVDGGKQRRCFTYIDDGICALMKIIENKDDCAKGKIFNIGNPNEEHSIAELAERLLEAAVSVPYLKDRASKTKIVSVPSNDYYGGSYQDTCHRVPSIDNAKRYLNWQPKTGLSEAIKHTLDFYFAGK